MEIQVKKKVQGISRIKNDLFSFNFNRIVFGVGKLRPLGVPGLDLSRQ